MNKLKSKWFKKWANKARISDELLIQAISETQEDNTVDLGGGVFKVRIAREGQGKSSGYRTLLLYKESHIAIFVYGFAKNERDNTGKNELKLFKKQADHIFEFDQQKIDLAIMNGEFINLED